MATFYQRLQVYYQRPNAIPLSKKQVRKQAKGIQMLFDKRNPGVKPVYTQSIEGDQVYEVRLYPDSYIATIDRFINVARTKTLELALKIVPPVYKEEPKPPKRERTRKPVPAFKSHRKPFKRA